MAHTVCLVGNISSFNGHCKNIGSWSEHIGPPGLPALSAHLPCLYPLLTLCFVEVFFCKLIRFEQSLRYLLLSLSCLAQFFVVYYLFCGQRNTEGFVISFSYILRLKKLRTRYGARTLYHRLEECYTQGYLNYWDTPF